MVFLAFILAFSTAVQSLESGFRKAPPPSALTALGSPCVQTESPIESDILKFAESDSLKLLSWEPVVSGHAVDPTCEVNFPPDFKQVLAEVTSEGRACLRGLHGASGKPTTGASINLAKLEAIAKEYPSMQVSCSDVPGFKNGGSKALASTGPEDSRGVLKHPFISMNPSYTSVKPPPAGMVFFDRAHLKNTLFHEHFHTIGHGHGEGIEYAHACADCCMGVSEVDQLMKEASCRVCTGDYRSQNDPAYLRDLVKWARSTSDRSTRAFNTNLAMKEIKRALTSGTEKRALLLSALETQGKAEVLAPALALLLEEKYKDLTISELQPITRSKSWLTDETHLVLKEKALKVGKGFLLQYVEDSPDTALAHYATLSRADFPQALENRSLNVREGYLNLKAHLLDDLWNLSDYYDRKKDYTKLSQVARIREMLE